MTGWRETQQEHQRETDGEHVPYNNRYWTAQICLAGHVQEGGTMVVPSEKYCECGAETIHQCPSCKNNIRGAFRPGGWDRRPPMGCRKCGTQYPWTKVAIEKISQLIDESELSTVEKLETTTDLESIVRNTPGAELAARRTHERLVKAGGMLRTAYAEIVVPLLARTLAEIIKSG